MAVHGSRYFCLLTVVSLAVLLLFLTWEHLSQDSGFSIGRRGDASLVATNFTMWGKENGSSPPPARLATKRPEVPNQTIKKQEPTSKAVTPMRPLLVKSFRKLPRWDFEDVYRQDEPPRRKTCAKSLRNTKDQSFREAFLPDVRLFLHRDNVDVSEWNRLSHFNSPFGFMGYDYEEVMAAVRLIPKPREPLLRPKPGGDGCLRCAVVGTGGILNGSRMGAEIDAHDYVFRMNGAITKGYEDDVGKRTSVYVHSAHSIVKSPYLLGKYGYKSAPHDEGIKYVMMPEELKDFQWLEGLFKGQKVRAGPFRNRKPITYYSGQYNESRFYVLHQDFMRYVRNRFLKSPKLEKRNWAVSRPTNGAFTIFLALHTCDIVDTYGFLTSDYNKYSDYYAEKTIRIKKVFHPHHDYELEMNLWRDLHRSKIMTLYQRNKKKTKAEIKMK